LAQALRVASAAWRRFVGGAGLDRALEAARQEHLDLTHPRLGAAAQDIVYGATRRRALIEALLARLAAREPDVPVAALLAVALGQLLAQRQAEFVVVDQAVAAAKANPSTRAASGFVNALLRNFLRQRGRLLAEAQREEVVRLNAPAWWLARLRAAQPRAWQDIARLALEPPPLVLRVNPRRTAVEDYLARLRAAGIAATRVGVDAVALHQPRPVAEIPGFARGAVSVQDAGAQLAVPWLGAQSGQRVLDACAAPGGKTAQLLELHDALEIDAVEIDPERARRIEENLTRTGVRAHGVVRIHVADAAEPARDAGAGERRYQRILLDAPCTASGIVRRHPDIPWLRRPRDVAQLATLQTRLLDALWPLLEPAGRLLYVVCSVFPEEGPQQIGRFAARHPDARICPLPGTDGNELQLLPVHAAQEWTAGLPTTHDGFFFALLEKA
jgi:16S rRNA (cytosine967-C5)-methyltransferase